MVLGSSFFESRVKFKPPDLDKMVGLTVGRTVFFYFHRLTLCVDYGPSGKERTFLVFLNTPNR